MTVDTQSALTAIRDADPSRPFVVAQLGQSLDGRIATPTGESRWINRDAALDHLHRLRAEVDAIVVGIGTVIADDPLLNVRRTRPRDGSAPPARIVIDPSGKLPATARIMADDGAQVLVVNAHDSKVSPPCRSIAVERDDKGLCPRAIVTALFERGFKKILIEGGAHTVSRFIDAQSVDRLHVLLAPMIIGSGKTGLDLSPIDKLDKALRPPTNVYALADGDVLFDCDLAAARANLEDIRNRTVKPTRN